MRINNVLLICPSTNKIWKDELKNKLGTAPLGLASISSTLKLHGYNVKMIDMLVECETPTELLSTIEEFKPDIIGISASYTESINTIYKIVRFLKKKTGLTIIGGGVHVTYMYEEALNNGFDFITLHEGEPTMVELFEYLKSGTLDLKLVKNIAYKDENNIIVTEKRNYIEDLNLLPFPDLLSLPVNRYVTPFAVITSRGCPGDCVYCSSRAMSGKRYRMRSAESIFSEIFYLSDKILKNHYNLKSYIAIYDDTFTVNNNRLRKFCNYMISSGLNKILWKCESRIDVLTEDLIILMKKAGCFAIHVGVESAEQSIIDSLNKHIRVDKICYALNLMNKNGIQPLCSFIVGNHEDTHETLESTKKFIEHIINLYHAKVAISPNTPLPGTPLYNNPDKYGIQIKSSNWDDYSLTNTIINTKNLTSDEIREYFVNIAAFAEVLEGN